MTITTIKREIKTRNLDILPDVHALNTMYKSRVITPLLGDKEKWGILNDVIQGEFIKAYMKNPTIVTDKDYMEALSNIMTKSYKEECGKYALQNHPEDITEFQRVIGEGFDKARKIWEDQFNLIKNAEYQTMFQEGVGIDDDTYFPDPLSVFAHQRRIKIIGLDKDGFRLSEKYKGIKEKLINKEISQEEYQQLDREKHLGREMEWVDNIDNSLKDEKALLIVGRAHANNDYGLIDGLKQKNITVNRINGKEWYAE